MNKLYFLGILATAATLVGCAWGNKITPPLNNSINNSDNNAVVSGTLKTCPEEKIINTMPGIGGADLYYILNGKRREIAEFDSAWVASHCQVPVQEVQ